MKKLLLILLLIPFICSGQTTRVGHLIVEGSWSESGVVTPATLDEDQDNYILNSDTRIYRLSASQPVTITGFQAQGSGKKITLINTSAYAITLPNEHTSSDAANRIIVAGQGQAVIVQNGAIELWYDESQSRWIVITQVMIGG
jgi:hypothetical protein